MNVPRVGWSSMVIAGLLVFAGCAEPTSTPEPPKGEQTHSGKPELSKPGVQQAKATPNASPEQPAESLLKSLQPTRPVRIEAFVSPIVPKAAAEAQRRLLAVLESVKALNNPKIEVQIFRPELFSVEDLRARQRFGITPRPVPTGARSAIAGRPGPTVDVFLGVAVLSGYERIIYRFLGPNTTPEYEIVRSLYAVAGPERKRIGLVKTGASVPNMSSLQREYRIVEIDPASPITEKYDALLAVQPSMLGPKELGHFVDAVRAGQPAVIFEDPFPLRVRAIGTSEPRFHGPPGMQRLFKEKKTVPKGKIEILWQALGIAYNPDKVVWQDLPADFPNPNVPKECVILGFSPAGENALSKESRITSQLKTVGLSFPGAIARRESSTLEFAPLLRTSAASGVLAIDKLKVRDGPPSPTQLNPHRKYVPTDESYVLAAHVFGGSAPGSSNVTAIVVADVDVLAPNSAFDNVKLISNALDVMAGDERFLALRTQQPEVSAGDGENEIPKADVPHDVSHTVKSSPRRTVQNCPQYIKDVKQCSTGF